MLLQTGVHLKKTFPLDSPDSRGGVTGEECYFLQHLLRCLMLILHQYHFICPLSLDLEAHSLLGNRDHPCLHKSFYFSCSSIFSCNHFVPSHFSLWSHLPWGPMQPASVSKNLGFQDSITTFFLLPVYKIFLKYSQFTMLIPHSKVTQLYIHICVCVLFPTVLRYGLTQDVDHSCLVYSRSLLIPCITVCICVTQTRTPALSIPSW